MTTMKRSEWAGRIGVLAATGLLTVAFGPAASAARHHSSRSAGHGAYRGRQEYTLAGIRIGDTYRAVLARFGNPTETQLERITLVAASGGGPGGALGGGGAATIPQKIFIGPSSSGTNGAPGAGPGQGGPGQGGPGQGAGGLGGALSGALGGLGGAASLFQMAGPPPGFGGPGGFPGAGGAAGPGAGTMITPDHPEYRWIYDEPSASSLEFTFSPDGRVVQIRATGYHGIAKTLRGITLGMKYSQVVEAYGNPEKQDYDGAVLTIDYTDSAHVSFQFYNQRLVGITVAQVD